MTDINETYTYADDIDALRVQPNDPRKRGQEASRAMLIGEGSRFRLVAVHTRCDAVQWFVSDALQECPHTGKPEVVCQADHWLDALDALNSMMAAS